MRNLKRALSLAMASVMLLGMMVVGTSAKGLDDFKDASEVVNKDAVAVTSAIGIFDGYDDGDFKPENVVTRAEMAVIICKMLYGADVQVSQFAETKVFSDVPAWAEGYVNLCASLGIVAGVGDGKFDPNSTVTTAQAAMMLTKALGYFQNAKDFGDNWMLSATAKATQIGLYGDLKLSATAGLKRDDVAELVFNALTKAVPVQYNELLGVYYNENKGIIYSLTFYYTDTLGYKNFDLVYRTDENTDYGRPGTTWGIGSYTGATNTTAGNDNYGLNEDGSLIPEYVKMTSKDEIITVADVPTLVYTANTKENVIYKALSKSALDKYTWTVYADGEERTVDIPDNDKDTDYQYTKKGAQTEIYVNNVNETVTVVMINYYMAEVTKVKTDSDGEYATVRVLTPTKALWTSPIDERDIYCEGFEEDDYVVITVDVDEDGDSFVASIADPATAEGDVTRVKKNEDATYNGGTYVKLEDGAQYTYSAYTASDLDDLNTAHPTLDINYRLYLDPNGYVIGFKALDSYYDNYLYVKDIDSYLSDIRAKVVFSDGTAATIDVDDEWNTGDDIENIKALKGDVFAWTEDDGVYTLRQINVLGETKINSYKDTKDNTEEGGKIFNDKAYITSDDGTKYIVDEKTDFVDVDEKIVYTGFENVPDYEDNRTYDADEKVIDGEDVAFWTIDSNNDGVADVVFIYSGEAQGNDDDFFYVADTGAYETYDKNKAYKEHTVYVDGEKTSLIFSDGGHKNITAKGLYQIIKSDGNGVVTKAALVAVDQEVETVGSRSFWLKGAAEDKYAPVQYVTDSDTIIVLVTYDLKTNGVDYKDPSVAPGTLKDMDEDDDYDTYVKVAATSDKGATADLVYIVKYEKSEIKTVTVKVDGETYKTVNVKDGKDYSVTYTVPAGKIATYAEEEYAAGEVITIAGTVDGKNVTANITLKDEPVVETVTLTLKGDLLNATVWSKDGSAEYEATEIKSFGTVTAKTYEVVKGTEIVILDGETQSPVTLTESKTFSVATDVQ